MTIHLGDIPASTTIYIPFNTFDANGASVTISGLATSDIQIYKNGSTTQRASVSGFTLLDTDGIDFDSNTGIHGFSVDLSDNTDAGFYSVGGFYWIVVASVTANAQTVNFVAATFKIRPAESVAGYPLVDTQKWLGGTIPAVNVTGVPIVDDKYLLGTIYSTPATAGIQDINLKNIANAAVSTSTAQLGVNVVNNAGSAITSASGVQEVKVASIAANAITATSIAADAITAAKVADGTIDAATFAAGAINAAAIAADAITDAKVAADVTIASVTGAVGSVTGAVGSVSAAVSITGDLSATMKTSVTTAATAATPTAAAVTGAVGSVTGAVGSVTGNVGGNVTGSVGSVVGSVGSVTGLTAANLDVAVSTRASQTSVDTIDDFVDTEVAAIKAKTDQLVFTVTNQVDVNVVDWKGSAAPAMTGDAYARLGAPAGASVSADVAAVKVDTAAVKAKTDSLPSDPADESLIIAATDALATLIGDVPTNAELATALGTADDATLSAIAALSIPTANQNADALLDRANAIETGLTPRQAMRLSAAADGGKLSGAATATNVIRNAVADDKDRITATTDSDGNRTAITYDLT